MEYQQPDAKAAKVAQKTQKREDKRKQRKQTKIHSHEHSKFTMEESLTIL
jgi:calcineurin-like phosphoesterase family protein